MNLKMSGVSLMSRNSGVDVDSLLSVLEDGIRDIAPDESTYSGLSREEVESQDKAYDLFIKKQNQKKRIELSKRVELITIYWLIFTGFIVFMSGFKMFGFNLSNGVLIAFITTSLGTVLGLWTIALNYFFKKD